jgi:excisionase family DNA binding protein
MKRLKKSSAAQTLPQVLTVHEVSEYLRVHPTTIYRLLHSKQIPGFLVGSEWRFNKDSIDRMCSGEEQPVVKARRRSPKH